MILESNLGDHETESTEVGQQTEISGPSEPVQLVAEPVATSIPIAAAEPVPQPVSITPVTIPEAPMIQPPSELPPPNTTATRSSPRVSDTPATPPGTEESTLHRARSSDKKQRKRSSLKNSFEPGASTEESTIATERPGFKVIPARAPLMAVVGTPRARSNTVNEPAPLASAPSKPRDLSVSTSKPKKPYPRRPSIGTGAGEAAEGETDGEPSWAWDELNRQLDAEEEATKKRNIAHAAHRHGAGASNFQYVHGYSTYASSTKGSDMWWLAFETAWQENKKKGKGIRTWWDLEKFWKPSDVFAAAGEDETPARPRDEPAEAAAPPAAVKSNQPAPSKAAEPKPEPAANANGEKTLVSSSEHSPRHSDSRNSLKTLAASTSQSKRHGSGKHTSTEAPRPLPPQVDVNSVSGAPIATAVNVNSGDNNEKSIPQGSVGHSGPATPSVHSGASISPLLGGSSIPPLSTSSSSKRGASRRRYQPVNPPKKTTTGADGDSTGRKTTVQEEVYSRLDNASKSSDLWKMWEEAEKRWATEDDACKGKPDSNDAPGAAEGDAASPPVRERTRRTSSRPRNRSNTRGERDRPAMSRRGSLSATVAAAIEAAGTQPPETADRRGRNSRPRLHIETDFTKPPPPKVVPPATNITAPQRPKEPKPGLERRATEPARNRSAPKPTQVQPPPQPQAQPQQLPQPRIRPEPRAPQERPQAQPRSQSQQPFALRAVPLPQKATQQRAESKLSIAWRQYDSKWESMLASHTSSEPITFATVPWPVLSPPRSYSRTAIVASKDAPTGKRVVILEEGSGLGALSTLAIAQFLMSPEHSIGIPARERLRRAIRRWHSDKFSRFTGRIRAPPSEVALFEAQGATAAEAQSMADEKESQYIMEGVGVVARALTQLLELERGD